MGEGSVNECAFAAVSEAGATHCKKRREALCGLVWTAEEAESFGTVEAAEDCVVAVARATAGDKFVACDDACPGVEV